ncbi:aldehyde dehydrogenase family protein [Streptomyces sp. NPDC021969]|uniref:aldehyde dehydrogenase family protein n=1 Tax=unclassified Streptomyces TaxID=2593676 RepID=UPI003403EB25
MSEFLTPEAHAGLIHSGGWVAPSGGTAEAVEAATGRVLAVVGHAAAEDVERAVRTAAAAQRGWAASGHRARAEVMRRAAEILSDRRDEVAEWLVREAGSVRGKADFEIAAVLDELLVAASLPGRPPGVLLPEVPGRRSYAVREPLGVVGVISPWNVPLVLAMRALAPALALGNAVVLKPDPRTAVCGGYVVARLFEEAGLPPGVLHVLPGGADAGRALVDAPQTAMLAFTGSTEVGRAIGERAGRALKRASLELGGNNALIVLDDADVEQAAEAAAFSSFFHQGQVCMAAGRHVVVESVAVRYTAALVRRARAMTVGDPWTSDVDLGPLIDDGRLKEVHRLVGDAVAAGARLECGGTVEGPCYRPTVLTGVDERSEVWSAEVFGPVAPVVTVPDAETAVAVANRTEYGLVASVFGGAGAEAVARELRTGMVHVNDPTIEDDAIVPFGGTGASGNGSRHGSLNSWDEFTRWRWTTVRGS